MEHKEHNHIHQPSEQNGGHEMHDHNHGMPQDSLQEHKNHDHQSHDHAGGHMAHMGNLRQKFWVSLIITIPIIMLSSMMGLKLPFQFSFPGSDWVVLILATFLFFYGGMPFLQGAKMELKGKTRQ